MNYKKFNNKNLKQVYIHDFHFKKGLSYNQVGKIIDNFERHFNYDFKTGIFEFDYMIPREMYKVSPRILHIEIPFKKGLTKQEKDNIVISISFQYDTYTGIFTAIHKFTY